jgi:hypothetical protein
MVMYLDLWKKGAKSWQRIKEADIPNDKEEKFITWQRYISEDAGEHGVVYGNLVFDFDDNSNPDNARLETIKMYDRLIRYGVKPINIHIYFSGKKGFHVEIDYRSFMDKPVYKLHEMYKLFYLVNIEAFYTLDV